METLKKRLHNWAFVVAIASLLSMVLVDLGVVDAPLYIDKYLNAIFVIGTALGIWVDPTTKGLKDGK